MHTDKIPESPDIIERWTSSDGRATLLLGDCLKILPLLHGVDAIVTDPPYGMDCNTDYTRFSGGNTSRGFGRNRKKVEGDATPFDPSPWIKYRDCVLFGANHFWSRLPKGGALVWIKRNDAALNTFMSDCEIAFIKGRHGVFGYKEVFAGSSRAKEVGRGPQDPSGHPTQKPVALMRWVIGYTKGFTVLDPYMGSGTTGVAAIMEGRKFIGIEIDREYYELSVARIDAATRQGGLFEPEGGR